MTNMAAKTNWVILGEYCRDSKFYFAAGSDLRPKYISSKFPSTFNQTLHAPSQMQSQMQSSWLVNVEKLLNIIELERSDLLC
jgi:hypothetical protein